AYIATEVHKAFHPLFHGGSEADKKKAAEAIDRKLAFIETKFRGPYLFGPNATVADMYLFVMLLWATKLKLKVPAILQAFSERMGSRPTVYGALKHEGLA